MKLRHEYGWVTRLLKLSFHGNYLVGVIRVIRPMGNKLGPRCKLYVTIMLPKIENSQIYNKTCFRENTVVHCEKVSYNLKTNTNHNECRK